MSSLRRAAPTTALLLALLAGVPAALAQETADPAHPDVEIPTAPVEVDGVALYTVRGASAFPAEMRAALHARHIVAAAQDPKVDPNKLEIVEAENGLEIKAGDRQVGFILEADARLEGLTRHELALGQRKAVKNAIVRYREARTGGRLGTAAAHALAATAIFGALLALLLPVFRRVDRFVERHWKRSTEEIEAKSFELLRADRLQGLLRGTLRAARAVFLVALAY
jgi:hypothetical protein